MRFETFRDEKGRIFARPAVEPAEYDSALDCTNIPLRLQIALKDKPLPWVGGLLCGPTGVGKSYRAIQEMVTGLVAYTTLPLEDRNVPSPKFVSVPRYIATLQELQGDDRDERWTSIRRIAHATYLVLDDLGVEKLSEFVERELYLLLDHRDGEKMPTLVTSNLDPAELKAIHGDRILSRIRGCGPLRHLSGEDLRTGRSRA